MRLNPTHSPAPSAAVHRRTLRSDAAYLVDVVRRSGLVDGVVFVSTIAALALLLAVTR